MSDIRVWDKPRMEVEVYFDPTSPVEVAMETVSAYDGLRERARVLGWKHYKVRGVGGGHREDEMTLVLERDDEPR